MDIEWIREHCLSMKGATEGLQWGESLVFKVAGKMFAILNLDEAVPNRFWIKCTPEEMAELVEMEGIIPAPYLARNYWVCFQDVDALRRSELKHRIQKSYDLVVAKLPKKTRANL